MPERDADRTHGQLEQLLARVQVLMRAGNLAAAEKSATHLVEVFPQSTSAHEQLGDVLYAMGNSAQARKHYKRAMDIEPANADAERKFAAALLNISPAERRRQMIHQLVAGSEDHAVSPRRPVNAILAAIAFPGMGQLYNRQYEKGLAIFAAEAVLLILLFNGIVLSPWATVARQSADRVITRSDQVHAVQQLLANSPLSHRILLILGIAIYFATYIYCIYDAYTTARQQGAVHDKLGAST
jgi:tetratricopeptide (TPR) repeat protein